MATVKISINIDADKKKILEGMAKANYRSLTGEINIALDLYINHASRGATFINCPPLEPMPAPKEEEVKEVALTADSFGDDEVDEF